MDCSRLVLPNGLRVVVVPMPGVRSVTVSIFVGLGSRYEDDDDAGAAHLIEHMLFKGTARRPKAVIISDTIDGLGGILNASTDKEVTVLWAKVAQEHLSIALDLLSDMVCNSCMSPSELRREKRVIVEELKMLADDPQDWVHVLVDEILWPHHAVGREVAGTIERVQSMRLERLRRYFNAFYGSNNAVVALAGGIDPPSAFELVGEYFSDWRMVSPPLPKPVPAGSHKGKVRLELRTSEQVNMCIGFQAVSRRHHDFAALSLLASLLGGGTSSRLFVRLRETMGLAYDVHAYTTHLEDTGSFVVYAATGSQSSNRVLDAIFTEIKRVQRRTVRAAELDRVKQNYHGRLWLGLEDTHAVSSWFGFQEIVNQPDATPEAVAAEFDAVTARDVLRVARTYLDADAAVLAAVGAIKGLDTTMFQDGGYPGSGRGAAPR